MGLKPRFGAASTASRYYARCDRAASELAARHINERHMPDKAIDVVDEAARACD